MKQYSRTLVVDSSYMPRSIITSERAFVIAYKGNADVVYSYPDSFKVVNPKNVYKKPSVIRVYKYVKDGIHKTPLTRDNVFKRDGYRCVYCGSTVKKDLTIDHVIPSSKGGLNKWENLVTACKRCNNEKSDLTLEEYGKTIPKPYRPHYLMLIKQVYDIPEEWKDFLIL